MTWLAIFIITLASISEMTMQVQAAEPAYGKNYSIAQFLSDYQYFIETTANISFSHNVGSLAVGGDTTIGNFGDGAIEDSYLGNINSAGNYANGGYFQTEPDYVGYIGKEVYYGSAGSAPAYAKKWVEGTPYIDFTAAFSALRTESTALAASGSTMTLADIQSVIIDGQGYSAVVIPFNPAGIRNVTIPQDVYDSADAILISGLTANKLDSFQSQQYTINITGGNPVELAENPYDKQSPTAIPVAFEYNAGQNYWMQNSPYILKDMSAGVIQAGQMNMGGMKLIWNIPNATSVSVHSMPGHIVAPNASLLVTGGRFEGNVIAKSVTNATAEGHFYPFEVLAKNTGTPVTVGNIQLNNTYENNGITGLNSGSTFNLYTDAACSTAPIVSGTESVRTNTSDPFSLSIPGSSLSVSTSYYIKQATVSTDYVISSDVYECKVAADGTITYKKVGSTDSYTSTAPTVHNLQKTVPVTVDDIQLTKTFADNGITGLNSGAYFNLYTDAACSTAPVVSNAEAVRSNTTDPFVVNIDGTVLFPSNTYYLKEVTAPVGYDKSVNVYECKVASDGSITYKIQGSTDVYAATAPSCVNTVKVADPATAEDIQILKTFENNGITGLSSGAYFNLYTDAACSTAPVASNVEAVRANTTDPFRVTVPGTGLSVSATYYLKEVTAPTGYDKSANVYECKVASDGTVTYKIQGSADAYSAVFPVCVNEEKSANPVTAGDIVAISSFENGKITGLASGSYFTLYSDQGCTVPVSAGIQAIRSNLNDEFKATFPGSLLSVSRTYYFKEVTAPAGYAISDKVVSCNIDAAGVVTYKILGSTSPYSATTPVINNPETQSAETGTIKIKVIEKGTSRAIPNAVVYLTTPGGQKGIFSTDQNGEIALGNQQLGTYSLVVQSVPAGYQYDTGITYSLNVVSGNTAEKIILVENGSMNNSNQGQNNNSGSTTTATTIVPMTITKSSGINASKLDKVPKTGMR